MDAQDESSTNISSSANTSSSGHRRSHSYKRSDIWSFIRENDEGSYTCLLCPTDSACRWSSIAHTTFRRHLKRYHRDEYSGGDDEASEAAMDSKQTKLLAFGFERFVKQRTFDKAAADDQLVDLIVMNSLPFNLVEKKEFRSFCKILEADYTPPTRKTVRKKVIQRWTCEKELARHTMLQEIASCRVSATTDMWTSAAQKGYMVVTLHWINDEWAIKSVVVGFTRVEYPHSGVRLADHLMDTLRAMDESLMSKLWAITADNATNNGTMVRKINETLADEVFTNEQATATSTTTGVHIAGEEGRSSQPNVIQVRCLAHVLQLAVREGMKACPIMDDSVGSIRDILKKISDSPSLLEALQEVCAAVSIKYVSPELDCVTRWNSTLTMLASARALQKAIEELLRRIRERHEGYRDLSIGHTHRLASPISETTWSYLAEFTAFLKPIKAATTMMSGKNYPTFGVTLVVFHLISKHASKIMQNAESWYTRDFARAFKTKLDEYLPLVKTREARIAAVLDPRAKEHIVMIDGDIEQVKRLVENEYESVYRSKYERTVGITVAERTQEQKEEDDDEEALYGLIDEHLDLHEPVNNTNESFESELKRWLEHKDRSMNLKTGSRAVCNWMKNEAASFPRIQMMARLFGNNGNISPK